MNSRRRVVITGLGIASPIGIGAADFWDALLEGRSGLGVIDAFDPAGFPGRYGGSLPEFKLPDYIPKTYRKSAKVMARDIQIAVISAYTAVRDAGLVTKCIVERGEAEGPIELDSSRFGANIGAGLICADLNELAGALATARDTQGRFDFTAWGETGMTELTPLWLLKFLPNMLACHVTIVHDAQAISNTITCGEASSHLAIGEAYRAIARGNLDVSLCGGAESKLNPMAIARPTILGRVHAGTDVPPDRASAPFATTAAGMVLAEGGGLVVLEELEHARQRGARVYAELVGFGAATDTHSWYDPDPQGHALARALRSALADADVEPGQVDLVNPFGPSIPDFDASESAAWQLALGDRLGDVPALAIKGSVGLNGAGSGALDLAATALAVHGQTVPASRNTQPLRDGCRLRFAADHASDAPVQLALSAAYTLAGGQQAALVLRRYEG